MRDMLNYNYVHMLFQEGFAVDAMDVIRARHSVRRYTGKPLEGPVLQALNALIEEAREGSGLNIQLDLNNPNAFNVVARFGLIKGCSNCIVFPGTGHENDPEIGYWGQHIVLGAQELGLNTCWAMLCARKKLRAQLQPGQRIRVGVAVGYGAHNGKPRPTKEFEQLFTVEGETVPSWFALAAEAAQLAPTGMNNQDFHLTLKSDGKTVVAQAREGALRVLDLGIVRYNFERAAKQAGASWVWENRIL